jgi:hypothetical protein
MHRTNSCPSLYEESGLPNPFWLIGVDAHMSKYLKVLKSVHPGIRCIESFTKKLFFVACGKKKNWSWKIAIH